MGNCEKIKYMIYGTGNQAGIMLDMYESINGPKSQLVGFMNSGQQVGEHGDFRGYKVWAPKDAVQEKHLFDRIAIATSDFYDDIKNSLINEYKVNEKQIGYGGEFLFPFQGNGEGLAITIIVRNEVQYLREWIEFHKLVGVTHFYVYDNESTDGLEKFLEKYIENGIVTYTYWPGDFVQTSSYDDALQKYGSKYKYMAFIDADEFIVPVKGNNLVDELDKIYDKYEGMIDLCKANGHVGSFGINWRNYGTSYHKKHVDGFLVENFKYRAEDDYFKNMMVKTICIPERVECSAGAHHVKLKKGFCSISEKGAYINNGCFPGGTCDILRINHYYSKSEEDCIAKYKRGWPCEEHDTLAQDYISNRIVAINSKMNDVYDDIMDRFLPKLKEEISKCATDKKF